MLNQTVLKEFFLSGLSDLPAIQFPLFFSILLIYLLTLFWNLLIVALIITNSHLHVPMYFFLGNLASLDFFYSSVTVPRMLFDLHTGSRKITKSACMTQVFFFLFFAASETFLLSVMSYDRYMAICQPLHYIKIMSCNVCVRLMSFVWCLSLIYSLVQTFYASKLTFCGSSHIIESFFCDLPQVLQNSCSDISINILLIFILRSFLGGGSQTLTFLSYVYIFRTILKIKVTGTRSKVFSTCTPHLLVVVLYQGFAFFNYFQLKFSHHFTGNKGVSIFYTVILPFLNPLIYSLRNQDIRAAFRDVVWKIIPNAR
ncbi:olfactory receptor 8B8-like [Pyxicephalus adspersus]|uniref:Olfactory receptor n=1 Tax=Pyxicephalus adspersus TaxID=30357 RepID=A0AAV2ZLJ4_PYXAD|nr:TPA: hypothetical protein GDO54_014792 [Pyxicephalus adspersus]